MLIAGFPDIACTPGGTAAQRAVDGVISLGVCAVCAAGPLTGGGPPAVPPIHLRLHGLSAARPCPTATDRSTGSHSPLYMAAILSVAAAGGAVGMGQV